MYFLIGFASLVVGVIAMVLAVSTQGRFITRKRTYLYGFLAVAGFGGFITALVMDYNDPPPQPQTQWSVMKSPETGQCYEVVIIPRTADLVHLIAPEFCEGTLVHEK